MDDSLQILVGNCYQRLRVIPDRFVQCAVTSPPYWGLRDYGIPGNDWPAVTYRPMPGLPPMEVPEWRGCLGLEEDPFAFIGHLIAIFREVRRTLADDGTLWVNLGDSYSQATVGVRTGGNLAAWKDGGRRDPEVGAAPKNRHSGFGDKNLLLMPHRFALAMQADGWTLRSEIIWNKPNPMPESVQDRPTKAHEQIFLFSKGPRYFYDKAAASEPAICGTPPGNHQHAAAAAYEAGADKHRTKTGLVAYATKKRASAKKGEFNGKTEAMADTGQNAFRVVVDLRNWRDVWTIPSEPYREAHFATFPTALPRRCILAGSRPGDWILDPFGGSGTTAAVAIEEGRRAVICEANPEYARLAEARICGVMPGLGI